MDNRVLIGIPIVDYDGSIVSKCLLSRNGSLHVADDVLFRGIGDDYDVPGVNNPISERSLSCCMLSDTTELKGSEKPV